MKIKNQEAQAEVIASFQESIAKLEAHQELVPGMPAIGYILQFENGLAVKVLGSGYAGSQGKPGCHVCAIWAASVFKSGYEAKCVPEIKNGHGEIAQPVEIQAAIAKEIAKLQGLIAQVEAAEVLAA